MSNPDFQAPSPEDLAELLPQYDIEFFIAQGGMGAVYKGRQISLDRDIAIKVLPIEMGQNEQFRESFITEAKAMARLNHPNLLGVFDYGDVEGMPYIVMEYVDGESLHDAAWNQAIEAWQAVDIVKAICDGLAHAHQHGIIHRDIKPSNILLTTSIEAKVADFGLAQASDSDSPGLDMGTPGYTAPEVFQDASLAGPLADIYAVGVIFHQLLSGTDPAGSMEPPTEATGNLLLDKVWRKATSVDPSKRYQSAAAMAKDLENWSNAKKSAPVRRANPAPVTSYNRPIPVQTVGGGGGGVIKLLVVTLVVVIGGFIILQMKDEKKDDGKTIEERSKIANTKRSTLASKDEEGIDSSIYNQNSDNRSVTDPDGIVESLNPFEDPDFEAEPEPEIEPEPEPEIVQELPPGDPELRERAIGLILDARKKRNKELSDNVRSLVFAVDTDSRDTGEDVRSLVEEVKDSVAAGRVPTIGAGAVFPSNLTRAFERALSKEQSIDANHRSELVIIRDAYETRLEGAAKDSSEDDLKKRLMAQAERASDLDAWISLLAPEAEVEKTVLKSIGGGASSVVGNWDNTSYNNTTRWIAHPDGRMEIVGKDWEVTWVLQDDGTLIVDWNKKAPYRYKLEGDRWVGTNPHDGEATLTRGDW